MAFQKLHLMARSALRRSWLNYALHDVSNNDNHEGIERTYRITDPWSLDSPREHARFEATNRVIESRFGKVSEILEIGSGEGVQSTYLRRLCQTLYGVDVSPTAVQRARARLPDAHFMVGDLAHQPWVSEGKRFDLVVACEVLYYIADVRATLELMNKLGDACFVSFFSFEAYKLSTLVESIPGVETGWFNHDRITWLLAWWRNPRQPVSASV